MKKISEALSSDDDDILILQLTMSSARIVRKGSGSDLPFREDLERWVPEMIPMSIKPTRSLDTSSDQSITFE